MLYLIAVCFTLSAGAAAAQDDPLAWPPIHQEHRPGAYWHWMGSAVDEANLTRELEAFKAAGFGGAHIVPIYGAQGYEDRYVPYLSPRWMQLLEHTLREAQRLDLWIDMTTGTGWNFGGPQIPEALGCAELKIDVTELSADAPLPTAEALSQFQAALLYGPSGEIVPLADLAFSSHLPQPGWRLYTITLKPTGLVVERAAPGGEGRMLNPFNADAMPVYLQPFKDAFAHYTGPYPRAMYHDSYEYNGNWAPRFLEEFAARRGYRLEEHLPALLGDSDPDAVGRVQSDYRETLSDLLLTGTIDPWVNWVHEKGMLCRNQAHGSPGNLLDLYAAADIPETEMFNKDRDPCVAKFASSAAHVTGKPLVAAEFGTWIREHFQERLSDLKDLADELFISGVNQVLYHGTCYSPADAPWPGWLFYASTQLNNRSTIWHDLPALNEYLARCEAMLQAGAPDNDILLYWPIHDLWHASNAPAGSTRAATQSPTATLARHFTVHRTTWLYEQPLGQTARTLWDHGYTFDYISDRQLASPVASGLCAGRNPAESPRTFPYKVLLIPRCTHMPLETFQRILDLAETGATVLFEGGLPRDVPGLANLEQRRTQLNELLQKLPDFQPILSSASQPSTTAIPRAATSGKGRILFNEDLFALLDAAGVSREPLAELSGLQFIRRRTEGGHCYFITHRAVDVKSSSSDPSAPRPPGALDQFVPLAVPAAAAVLLDPLTGRTGLASLRPGSNTPTEVYLQLAPGQSVFVKTFDQPVAGASCPVPSYLTLAGPAVDLPGPWQVTFVEGGPELPPPFALDALASWTNQGGPAETFAGTARYTIHFDLPSASFALRPSDLLLDLGAVVETARVTLNGHPLGTLFTPPFHVDVPAEFLTPADNLLEINVTNLTANRVRDLDRRGVQ
ncbi:MAG: hypothetical protein HYZ00_00155, partial [Candidatus Hydrogenedentes bacterium]|nr:hypothetical protein [Candidatus Hydrogenedentota bacterium]